MELTISKLAFALRRFSEYLQRVGSELFAEAFRIHQVRSLSVQQLRYLEVIEANEGVTPAELATAFEVSKPTVSNILGQLESRGLIRARADQGDRRIRRLHPTEVTSDIFERRRGMYRTLAQHIETKLTVAEIEDMVALLVKAGDGLEGGNE
jgi:DNA-binding MarR family transcriptional regulator